MFYRVEYQTNNSRNVGVGVAIAVRNSLRHTIIPHINTKIIEAIGVEFTDNGRTVRLVSAYFPGSRLNKDKLNQFKSDIQILTSSRQNFLVCGDLNAKHRFWNCFKANQAGKILYDQMNSRNFLINFPPTLTHFPPQLARILPSTIDVVLSNAPNLVHNIRTVQVLNSEHLPVRFQIDFHAHIRPSPNGKRNFAKANWELFRSSIANNIEIAYDVNGNVPDPHHLKLKLTA